MRVVARPRLGDRRQDLVGRARSRAEGTTPGPRRGDRRSARHRARSIVRIGIDLGGTKIEGLALADDGRELDRRRIAAPRGSYDDTIRAVVDLVSAIEARASTRPRHGRRRHSRRDLARDRPDQERELDVAERPTARRRSVAARSARPVRLANDANCFALSEATDGAAAGAAVVFGVIIGTGTGGGLVVNGRIVVGANAIAGEWGHNPLPAPEDDERPGPPCYCGRSGCIETFLSGPALARDYIALGGDDLSAARRRGARRARRRARARPASIATSGASRARSPRSSTSSIRT